MISETSADARTLTALNVIAVVSALAVLGACSKQAPTTGTQLPLQPARALMALTRATLAQGTGPALVVIDLPSRVTQTLPLASGAGSAGSARPAALSAGTQDSVPWGFVLDSGSGAISGFNLSVSALSTPTMVNALADVIPNALAAGRDTIFALSSDASSQSNAVLWTGTRAQRLALFSSRALTPMCAASVTSGFAAVAVTAGAAEVVLVDAAGVTLSRMAVPGDATMRPLACAGQGDVLAIVTTGQLLTVSTKAGQLAAGLVATLPHTLPLGTHPRLALSAGKTALGTDTGLTLFDNSTGKSTALNLLEPGTVVGLAATADNTALLIGLGAGAEATALVAWFFAQQEEIPVARFGVAEGLVDIAVAAEP